MDIVYICRPGDNEELRYSIRSAVKNLKHNNVWVVGAKPDWYIGNFIPVEVTGSKYTNARNNLKTIAASPEISQSFLLMNDDFFVLNKINRFVNWHGGPLEEKVKTYYDIDPTSPYTKMLSNTYNKLIKLGFDNPLDYELHVPMSMQKDKLKDVLDGRELWRSCYGNMFDSGGEAHTDVKVYSRGILGTRSFDFKNNKTDYLSSSDDSFKDIQEYMLNDMFPKASKLELSDNV